MSEIKNSILSCIGGTPLVEISGRLNRGGARLLAKLEGFNPGGSAKDRVALAMVEAAENAGLLRPGDTIIEPTSGNTGVGLALVAAVRGYKMILTMPDTMSVERRRLAAAYGARIVLTPGDAGMQGAIAEAERLHAEIPGSFIPQQFENPANPAAHENSTGPEIWTGAGGKVDVFVAAVGTGGTLTGVARHLRSMNPGVEIVAVEPDASAVLSGGTPGPHRLQGIGAGFIPVTLDVSLISRVVAVSADDAGAAARACAASEGILVGISSGAALHAALRIAADPAYDGKTVVTVLPDTGERYLSTWLFEGESK